MKLAWATAKDWKEADVVVVGVPDESGSSAKRKGSRFAPNKIRKVSVEREVVQRGGKRLFQKEKGEIQRRIFDWGNVKKEKARSTIAKLVAAKKIPVVIGGDHSITAEVLKGMQALKKISLVYFDAHPDFICSKRKYYGSVVCDIFELRNIDFKSCVEVGIREPEREELRNIKKKNLLTITALDVQEKGVQSIFRRIKRRLGKNIYISIDMDVVDPAFAPGVSTPVPAGLSANQLLWLVSNIAAQGIVGLDVMEVNPKYDEQDRTAHLAAKLIIEAAG